MATQRQIEANRLNAQKNTGPKNTEKTCMNALKRGYRAKCPVLPNEDPREFRALVKTLQLSWQPEGEYEYFLVERIAEMMWRLDRASINRVMIIFTAQYRDVMEKELNTVSRYEREDEGSLYRAVHNLEKAQKKRGKTKIEPINLDDFNPEQLDENNVLVLHEGTLDNPEVPEMEQEGGVGIDLSGKLPRVVVEDYKGPQVAYIASEGEVAMEGMLENAKRVIRRRDNLTGKCGLEKAINKLADEELLYEDNCQGGYGSPPPPKNTQY